MNQWAPAADRIVAAREGAGVSMATAARAAGLSESAYYDLEAYNDEAFTSISVGPLCRLATALGTRAEKLVASADRGVSAPIPPEALAVSLKARMLARGEDFNGFAERIGWNPESMLSAPAGFWEHYNLDSLQDLCRDVGLDWEAVLASWHAEGGQCAGRLAEPGTAPDDPSRRT